VLSVDVPILTFKSVDFYETCYDSYATGEHASHVVLSSQHSVITEWQIHETEPGALPVPLKLGTGSDVWH
jgi:hypothetical protein